MKKFLAVYIGTASAREKSGWDKMDETKRKGLEASGMKAWGDWMTAHKASIVETVPRRVRNPHSRARIQPAVLTSCQNLWRSAGFSQTPSSLAVRPRTSSRL